MTAYRGVIRDHQVRLGDDARLPDGTRVEVRPVGRANTGDEVAPRGVDATAAEEALLHDLIADGLLEATPAAELGPDEPFEPVAARGEPLSAQIVRERR